MFKSTTAVLLGAIVAFSAARAGAQCGFYSGVGTKLKVPLVRAYAPCGYGGSPANTETAEHSLAGQSVLACAPIEGARTCTTRELCVTNSDFPPGICSTGYIDLEPALPCSSNEDCGDVCLTGRCVGDIFYSGAPCAPGTNCGTGSCNTGSLNTCTAMPTAYEFGPKGGCSLSAKAKVESDCSVLTDSLGSSLNLPSGPCHVTYVKGKCSGIVQADGETLIDGPEDNGWKIVVDARLTLNDDGVNDMTRVDFPFSVLGSIPEGGRISFEATSAQILDTFVPPAGAALPTCTTMGLVAARVLDPSGTTFATVGLSTR